MARMLRSPHELTGCLPSKEDTQYPGFGSRNLVNWEFIHKMQRWDRMLCPTDDQGNSSCCVSFATCGLLESLLRDAGYFIDNIDALKIHQLTCKTLYPKSDWLKTGVQLIDTLNVLKSSGCPLDTFTVPDPLYGFPDSPLLVGFNVSQGFVHASHFNGAFDESEPGISGTGHATLLVMPLRQQDELYYLGVNSWGATYGWLGCYVASDQWIRNNTIAGFVGARLHDPKETFTWLGKNGFLVCV